MRSPALPIAFLFASRILAAPLCGQTPAAAASQIAVRQQRVDLLRDEIKQTDARIETRLDTIIDTLKSISDYKDSRTKVARMKEDTGKRLGKTITYYNQKRATLREQLRTPTLKLTDDDTRKLIAAFDAKIEKRAQQILDLQRSMPSHQDYERYKVVGSGWYGTEYQRNADYDQNRRMTDLGNQQRKAIVQQLEASIARLNRQNRDLKSQLAATKDPVRMKSLGEDIAKTDTLIAERRNQRVETLTSSGSATHPVALKQAMDMDKALQAAAVDLNRDFTTLFQRYNTFLYELSALRAAQAASPQQTASL